MTASETAPDETVGGWIPGSGDTAANATTVHEALRRALRRALRLIAKSCFWLAIAGLNLFGTTGWTQPHSNRLDSGVGSGKSKTQVYMVGLVEDGPCAAVDLWIECIQKELAGLLENRAVVFKRAPAFNAHWDLQRLRDSLEKALTDPDVDLVFVAGLLTFREALRMEAPQEKPMLGILLQDPDADRLSQDNLRRLAPPTNAVVLIAPLSVTRDLTLFHDLKPFKRLAVLADSVWLQGFRDFEPSVEKAIRPWGAAPGIIPMNQTAREVLDRLDAGSPWDAVYLTPAPRMSDPEYQALIDGLNARKLPVFSMLGHADVARGALVGTRPDDRERLARRLALVIRSLSNGDLGAESGAILVGEEKILINAKTAAAIGYSPRLDTIMTAELLYADTIRSGRPLSLTQAVNIALERNVTLEIKQAEVDVSRQDRNRALSALWPQVNSSLAYNRVNDDQSADSLGMTPERQTRMGANISQALFNDPAISRFRASRRQYEGVQLDRENSRMDVIEQVSKSYIRHLQAQALLRIQTDNLNLTHNNLSLARLRRNLGASGAEEVLRWEAQAASQRASLIKAGSHVDMARVSMNQTLGVEVNARWQTKDIVVRTNDFHFLGARLTPLLRTERHVLRFEDFAVNWGLRCFPGLAALDKQIEAQRLMMAQAERRFFVPELGAGFEWGRFLQRTRPDLPDGLELSDSGNRNVWMFGLQASLPLFEGGGLFSDASKAKAQLNQLCFTRSHVARQLEQRIRTVCYALFASYPTITLQRQAADFAAQNLDIVKDKYARGALTILELLDAQNQLFVAHQNAAIAVYAYLEDLVEFQRTLSWFESEKTEQEKDEWASRLAAFLETRQ